MKRILIIDDDAMVRLLLSELLKKHGYEVVQAKDGASGLSMVKTLAPDLVITDYNMPGITGLDVVSELSRLHPGLPVIMLTAYGDVPLTIKSIQAGAFDYIEKPIQGKQLIETIRNGLDAFEKRQSISKPVSRVSRFAIEESLPVGKTPLMKNIFKNIGRISMNRINVLITGESGTGKEKIARLIHHSGITREHPMVTVNCKASSESQLELDLFGYSKGALTGQRGEKIGKLEQVGEGTLFLDEFPDLSDKLQAKVHNVLQDRSFFKPGVEMAIPFKARVISASSKNLEDLVNQGILLKELYYQLKVLNIYVPPLRQRKDDIPELVEQLLQQYNRKLNKQINKIEDGVLEILKKYDWQGNIRELENTLVQAMLLSRGDVLEKQHVLLYHADENQFSEPNKNLTSLAEVEKEHIKNVLDAIGWGKQEAARILEIARPTLNAKIDKYQLKPT
ncbi:MAG: sigma-54 dependent transcriptional regulator [Bacteroidales bacterium]|nr:sigma-54 dependent transcriptional regulator [Bacteroidales bacterium]MDZ4203827.1 sigma-54 dependent transcriptional regulator [Bacteroidales bacterium]